MPTVDFTVNNTDLKLSARPDRLDLRDRPYSPPLTPLRTQFPEEHEIEFFLKLYEPLILDQGKDGACTGFGLAAVINYQFWFRDVVEPAVRKIMQGTDKDQVVREALNDWPQNTLHARRVSPRMLYQLARLYDEWDGEDYTGSSCRGAMRGWHHHGVCLDATWPNSKKGADFEDAIKEEDRNSWLRDAALRPLGAYYRIAKDSISDMQAAIQQVHAIFVSGWVHDGWRKPQPAKQGQDKAKDFTPYPIQWTARETRLGGHAFAIVGYNQHGFIVQNSWGAAWANRGFALLTYGDWLANGVDAWASMYGAPTSMVCSPKTKSSGSLQNSATRLGTEIEDRETAPWDDNLATLHTVVLGKNGRPMSRLVHAEDGAEHLQICAQKRIRRWCTEHRDNDNLVIYAHSGLADEASTLQRSAILGPYFKANRIYPLFLSWTNGVLDDLETLFRDSIAVQKQKASGGHLTPSELDRQIKNTSFYTWEAIASSVSIRAIWTERKENAALAALKGGAMHTLATHLHALQMAYPELKIHLVGHSAGVFLLASLLRALADLKLPAKTMTLWTPACSMQYAADTLAPLIKAGAIARNGLFVETIGDEIEKEDTVGGLYQQSFLYLVSRALEREHKTPLLGLEKDWNSDTTNTRWADFLATGKVAALGFNRYTAKSRQMFSATHSAKGGQRRIATSHCSYDQSIRAMDMLLRHILGRAPKQQVTDLKADQAH